MEFRGYRVEDFEAMFRLDEACFGPEFRFSRAMMRGVVQAKQAIVVIAEDNGLAGFCVVHVEPVEGGCVGYVVTLDVADHFLSTDPAEIARAGWANLAQKSADRW